MTILLAITIAGAALFPDANNIEFDTAKDCGEAATLMVMSHQGPMEAVCWMSKDGKSLDLKISVASRSG